MAVCYLVPFSTEEQKISFTRKLRATLTAVFFLPFNMAFANALYLLAVLDSLVRCSLARSLTHNEPAMVLPCCLCIATPACAGRPCLPACLRAGDG